MNLKSLPVFRVVFESREHYRVMDENKNIWPAKITGKLRDESGTLPTVGDWVEGSPQPGEWILIERLMERKSVLARKDPQQGLQVLAANIDFLFIVTSANQDLNLNRLDRYIALATTGNMQPVILVNKIELATDAHALLDEVAARFKGIDVHGMSAHEQWNLESLSDYAYEGTTVAFVGSSGVGKSSLTNALLGEVHMQVQEIRDSDGRGRHTTTHRELHVLNSGAVVIDTPGIRQVGLTDDTDLGGAFEDVESLFQQCKFGDCAHNSEPGCAIHRALNDGTLEHERWQSYLKLQKEIAYERRKVDKSAQSEERKKWAKINVAQRQKYKMKGR